MGWRFLKMNDPLPPLQDKYVSVSNALMTRLNLKVNYYLLINTNMTVYIRIHSVQYCVPV